MFDGNIAESFILPIHRDTHAYGLPMQTDLKTPHRWLYTTIIAVMSV